MMIYFIPTPIGNLKDITLRALELFEYLNIFLCEEINSFKKLLNAYKINYKNKKFFQINKIKNIDFLKNNEIGVVVRSGTPGISDPGKEIIKICWENNIKFTIIPGPTILNFIPAACFPTNEFIFIGFLPKKGRKNILKNIINQNKAIFFLESVHKIETLLNELKEINYSGKIFIAREATKLYEEFLCNNIENIKVEKKGEFFIGLFPNKI